MVEYDRRSGLVGGVGGAVWLLGTVAVTPLTGESPLLRVSQAVVDGVPGPLATTVIAALRSIAQPAVVALTACGFVVAMAVLGGYSRAVPDRFRRLSTTVGAVLLLTALIYVGLGLRTPTIVVLATLLATAPAVVFWVIVVSSGDRDVSVWQARRVFLKRSLASTSGALAVGALAQVLPIGQSGQGSSGPAKNDTSGLTPKRERGTTISSAPASVGSANIESNRVKHGITISRASTDREFDFDFMGMPEPVTPVENHYVVDKAVDNPEVDVSDWSLSIGGAVEESSDLSLSSLIDHEASRTDAVTMVCISNNVGGGLISTGRWVGVPLRTLVERAGPTNRVRDIVTHAADGYHEGIPWDYVREHPEVMIAVGLNGRRLTTNHGFPARLLIPGRYGMRSTKWLESIEASEHEHDSYWEDRGWNEEAVVNTLSAIRAVQQRRAHVGVGGIAFAGLRGVRSVEVSINGGDSWSEAALEAPPSPLAWRRWQLVVDRPAGAFEIAVRATDGTGTVQTQEWQKKHEGGATGWHRTTVDP